MVGPRATLGVGPELGLLATGKAVTVVVVVGPELTLLATGRAVTVVVVVVLPLPLFCVSVPLLLGFELWCVPPTAPPTAAATTTMMATTMMMMMPLRVRYHGTLATTGSWPFDADSSLQA